MTELKNLSDLHASDQEALETILRVRPRWIANRIAAEALNLNQNVILHAGPSFDSTDQITAPILNSACAALVYENIAQNFNEAKRMILDGKVLLEAAQNYSTVVPLAGVVSASMWLHEIVDQKNPSNRAFSPINGGSGAAMRLGMYSSAVVSHLKWLNGEFIAVLNECEFQNLDLISIASGALAEGDDCHGRTMAATANLVDLLQPMLQESAPCALKFLQDSPSFFLNLWMAVCKCMLQSGAGIPECSLITAAGGNGFTVGIQLGGRPDKWITTDAQAPVGDLGEFPNNRALGAIGDSAIVDVAGFGAMAVSFSPAQQQTFENFLPDDAGRLPDLLLPRIHDGFGALNLRTGLCARVAMDKKSTPIVSLGIIDNTGVAGRIGGGIYRYPLTLFSRALDSLHA